MGRRGPGRSRSQSRSQGGPGSDRWWKSQTGAILVEILVATLILAISIVPVFYALTAVLLSVDESLIVTIATNLLQDRAEALKAGGYDNLTLGTRVFANYDPRPGLAGETAFDLVEEISLVSTMTNSLNEPVVKKVVLTIYRHPLESNKPLARWEFFVYASGF